MPLSPQERRELVARAHHLKARVIVSADTLSRGAVEHVRGCFGDETLIKVRIRARGGAECAAAAARLAAGVPCELVARLGRVVVLYRPEASGEHAGE